MTTLVRKYKIKIIAGKNDQIKEIDNVVYLLANESITSIYIKDKLKNHIIREKIEKKMSSERENKINNFINEFIELPRELSKKDKYKIIPEAVRQYLCITPQHCAVAQEYEKYKKKEEGKASLPTFKKGMPMPFPVDKLKSAIERYTEEKGMIIDWYDGIKFEVFFPEKREKLEKSELKQIIDNIKQKKYNVYTSSIQYNPDKSHPLVLNLTYEIPKKKNELNKNLVVGVDLGINTPAYVALSDGYGRLAIGYKKDFLEVRNKIAAKRRKLQKSLKIVPGGKGRNDKLSALERWKGKEKDFAKTYNHMVAKNIIDFALKYNSGVIKMEKLKGIARDEKSKWVLRNWTYYDLQTKIEYKAKHNGIEIKYIDPKYTSQTCSWCGNLDKEQRETQSEFICSKNCEGFQKEAKEAKEANKDNKNYVNADYNAARNIAKSEKFVKK